MAVSFSLEGQVALVTGAGRGNGRAIAIGLADAGASLIATDRDADVAEATAEAIRIAGGQAWAAVLDVADREACVALARRTAREQPVSILVNNAGIAAVGPLEDDDSAEKWDRTLSVNLTGSYNTVRAFLAQLKETKGSIINIGSVLSFVGVRHALPYVASKGAVRQMTKALAVELAADGIRVNAIAPGFIETAMTERTREDPERLERVLAHTPMGRMGQPAELIGAAVFLASPAASYVTGVMLPVDGGYLAQ
ncbi:SDR family NAD(P)-dependent oxidoreductase [Chelatococcus reniformis]|uniref:Dehydrogenase n=1 Tax=Chelatococcus reniformis TaxID=1494448 RepID=A0A916XCE3_9HYPH|nr:SDR family NAD(P)-dependent oxidoreductase [Chelatococcus reniformis]GGC61476.1 dehydrogenase [Chelatococcus reniformis]